MVSSIFFFSWEEQVLQTPEEAAAPADSSGAAVASTATSANSAGMQEEQQKEPDPTSPEHAEQEEKEEKEESEEVWFEIRDQFSSLLAYSWQSEYRKNSMNQACRFTSAISLMDL